MDRPWFPERNRVRITVVKKLHNPELAEKYTDSGMGPCTHFEIGDQFVVSAEAPWEMPPGFCGWAWADIEKIVWGMARGGANYYVTCCTDGYRPVIFLLEKLTEDEASATD